MGKSEIGKDMNRKRGERKKRIMENERNILNKNEDRGERSKRVKEKKWNVKREKRGIRGKVKIKKMERR